MSALRGAWGRTSRRSVWAGVALALAAVLAGSGPAGAAGAPAGSLGRYGWGTAIEVPGTAALNQGGNASITSLSCPSAGNCSAGGTYQDSSAGSQVFVVSQANGTWHKAIEVPGTAALNQGGFAGIVSLSCPSAGNCSAGGTYRDSSGNSQAFVVSQANGTWGKAIEVPGSAALNHDGFAETASLSCASAGNCSAGGFYRDSSGSYQVFVVSQVHGIWHTAIEVPGSAALNHGGDAFIFSLSCGSAGNCGAGGYYADTPGHFQAFVVSQANGTWHTAIEVPGTAALNQGGNARITSVSCASAGNCGAGGFYYDNSGRQHALAVSQVHGTWGQAIDVPGTAALARGGHAGIGVLSCPSAGNCGAGGFYLDRFVRFQVFVVSQVHGTWHTAIEVPGTAALNQGGFAGLFSLSCGSAGNCSAGGEYQDSSGHHQALVVSQANGTWGQAIEVPGTAALNQGGFAGIASLSCPSTGNCSAGGSYTDTHHRAQAFVDSQT